MRPVKGIQDCREQHQDFKQHLKDQQINVCTIKVMLCYETLLTGEAHTPISFGVV